MHWASQQKQNAQEVLYGLTNIARFLGVSTRTLYRMRQNHDLPIITVDFHRFFCTRTALLNFLTAGIIKSLADRRIVANPKSFSKHIQTLARNGRMAESSHDSK